MKFYNIKFILLITLVNVNSIIGDEHEHHAGETYYDHYESDNRINYGAHSFDHDPHQDDTDYDEDVLTGTSHHEKKDAKTTKKEIEELFKNIDNNSDTKIEKEELITHLIVSMKQLHNESTMDEFEKVDSNKDKKVSFDEFSIFEHSDPIAVMDNFTNYDNSTETLKLKKRIQHEKDRFKAADGDADGFLNEHEYLLFKYPVFFPHMARTIIHDYIDDLDLNNDETIDKNEYISHFHFANNTDKEANEKSLKKIEQEFLKYDKDNNGKIDAEEYYNILKPGYEEPARLEADYLFDKSDSDKDEKLTLEEIEKQSPIWLGSESSDQEGDDDYGHHFDDEL